MTGVQLFLANNIIENSKVAICRKRSRTNHENQQLLMTAFLQHQKLISTSFLKIILLSSCQKTLLRSYRWFSRNNRNFWNQVWIYYPETRFKRSFRVTKGTFKYILDILTPYLQGETHWGANWPWRNIVYFSL